MSEEKHTIMLQGTDPSVENCKGVFSLLLKKKKKGEGEGGELIGFTIQKTFWSCHGNAQAQCFQYCCLQP